eukprot:GHVH01005597.1.p1 GENE.GHVH01005597.1~~GHVH01005597.1.p1  ORF type:complete len:613 (+),score=77.82 GHVH01005597.1:150-1841(+)
MPLPAEDHLSTNNYQHIVQDLERATCVDDIHQYVSAILDAANIHSAIPCLLCSNSEFHSDEESNEIEVARSLYHHLIQDETNPNRFSDFNSGLARCVALKKLLIGNLTAVVGLQMMHGNQQRYRSKDNTITNNQEINRSLLAYCLEFLDEDVKAVEATSPQDSNFHDAKFGVSPVDVEKYLIPRPIDSSIYDDFPIMAHSRMDGRYATTRNFVQSGKHIIRPTNVYRRLVIDQLKHKFPGDRSVSPEKGSPVIRRQPVKVVVLNEDDEATTASLKKGSGYSSPASSALDDLYVPPSGAWDPRDRRPALKTMVNESRLVDNESIPPWGPEGPIRGITWHKLHQVWEVRWYDDNKRRCKTFSVKKLGGNVYAVLQNAKTFLMSTLNDQQREALEHLTNNGENSDQPKTVKNMAGRKRRSTPQAFVSRKRYVRKRELAVSTIDEDDTMSSQLLMIPGVQESLSSSLATAEPSQQLQPDLELEHSVRIQAEMELGVVKEEFHREKIEESYLVPSRKSVQPVPLIKSEGHEEAITVTEADGVNFNKTTTVSRESPMFDAAEIHSTSVN